MNPNFKPQGYNSVSVYMMADDPQRVIDFLTAAFDAQPQRRYEGTDGSLLHAELKIDDSIVMIAGAAPDFPAFPVWLHVYVPDVDEAYRRALAAGGRSVQEPMTREGDPDKRGGVLDPAGNTWWISTQQE
jgi:uncharacterized glyoxalase superfamily protein PhnB